MKMSDGGKGSSPRKQQDQEAYANNYEAIFGKKKKTEEVPLALKDVPSGKDWLCGEATAYEEQKEKQNGMDT